MAQKLGLIEAIVIGASAEEYDYLSNKNLECTLRNKVSIRN